jgi:hypothetical protein
MTDEEFGIYVKRIGLADRVEAAVARRDGGS